MQHQTLVYTPDKSWDKANDKDRAYNDAVVLATKLINQLLNNVVAIQETMLIIAIIVSIVSFAQLYFLRSMRFTFRRPIEWMIISGKSLPCQYQLVI